MTWFTAWTLAAVTVVGALQEKPAEKPAPAQELERPADWIVRHDEPAAGATGDRASAQTLYFVKMPPGWHITTGPGTILYHPEKKATGRFRVEAEIFLFPGKSEGWHGLFYGGQQLDDQAGGPDYWAWLLSREGTLNHAHFVKGSYAGGSKGARHPAVVPSSPDKPVKNVLAVEVDGTQVRLLVNGQQVAITTPSASHDGTVGLRVDPDVNLHVTRLDVTPLP